MTIVVSEYNPETTDDIYAVNTDINELYIKIIKKIDMVRSSTNIAAGLGITANQIRTGQNDVETSVKRFDTDQRANPIRFMESRAHAFFRVMGFPTAANDGSFYSSGHNPRSSRSLVLNSVDEKLLANDALIRLLLKRETDPNDRRKIFANQDINATAYALAMVYPIPFDLIDPDSDDPFFADPQAIDLQSRGFAMTKYASNVAKQSISLPGSLDIAAFPSHILKPFIVSPVEKALPSDKRVAAPFMPSDNDLVVDGAKPPILRPAIEYIIRRRLLAATAVDNNFIGNVQLLLLNPDTTQTTEEIKNAVLALSGAENIGSVSPEFIDLIRNVTKDQVDTINKFVREIKGLVARLNSAVNDINKVTQTIVWQPIPNQEGPEFGGVSRYGGDGSATSVITQQIAMLKLFQMAQQSNDLGSDDYALVWSVDTEENYDEQIANLERQREALGSRAMGKLKEIEVITGEVSGLGLIDVLAVHTALWAIDIDTLLGFLDADAFDRLYNFNKELRASEAVSRRKTSRSTPSMIDTLKVFERQVVNVLSFAQNERERNKKNPRQLPSSDIR